EMIFWCPNTSQKENLMNFTSWSWMYSCSSARVMAIKLPPFALSFPKVYYEPARLKRSLVVDVQLPVGVLGVGRQQEIPALEQGFRLPAEVAAEFLHQGADLLYLLLGGLPGGHLVRQVRGQ